MSVALWISLSAFWGWVAGWWGRGVYGRLAVEQRTEAEAHRARARALAQRQDVLALEVALAHGPLVRSPRGRGNRIELGHQQLLQRVAEPVDVSRYEQLGVAIDEELALARLHDAYAEALGVRPLRREVALLVRRVKGWWRRG